MYRDTSLLDDSDFFPKTMLEIEQKMWFKQAIKDSDATRKIVQCSVPISISSGSIIYGHDGWTSKDLFTDAPNAATDGGFECELSETIETFKSSNLKSTAWITADVHFTEAFRYTAWGPNFYEVIVGPLCAVDV